MIEIENQLIEVVPEGDEIDGHDAGAGEVNIFIETDDPQRTFDQIRPALSQRGAWSGIRVAYRNVEDGPYTILWPPNLQHFSVA